MTVTDGLGRPVRDSGLARWLSAASPARARGDVTVALVADRKIRALNQRYRRKDAATDVLSFPAGPDRPLRHAGPPFLGDIVIATGVARRQASRAGHSYATELRVLALHGLLHLLGYDHDDDTDKGRMARAEARLQKQGGLPHGLISRARAAQRPRPARPAGGTRA